MNSNNLLLLILLCLSIISCKETGVSIEDKNDFSEVSTSLRAPSYPLITHNPNFSIWSMGDELNASPTKHWTEQDHSLVGIAEVDGELYRFLGMESKVYETIIPASDEENYTVDYTEETPDANWLNADFDASSWKKGEAPFSDDKSQAKTLWESDNLYYRRTFDLAETNLDELYIKLRHDDDVKVFVNGVQIYDFIGWQHSFKYIPLTDEALKTLKPSGNVLAIHVKNTAGGRWLDAGIVTVAKIPGLDKIKKAEQTNVDLTANQTIYTFDCGGSTITATFTSPLLIEDLKVYARPVTYLNVAAASKDGEVHNVKIYLGASGTIAANTPSQKLTTEQYEKNGLFTLKVGTQEQPVLEKKGDDLRVDWGYFYVASPDNNTKQYLSDYTSSLSELTTGEAASEELPTTGIMLNTVADLGAVTESSEHLFLLGYDEEVSVNYFGESLKPWYKKETESFDQTLANAYSEYNAIIDEVRSFDKELYNDALEAGGEKYADLCVLAYRQAIAAHILVESPKGEILFLSKENNSNGSINTVDVTYPSAPLFLVYNPDLLKGMLNGIFEYSESGRWKKPFPAHDLGTYPIATGQTYGEDMPVEEAGNMIILTAAIAQQEGNADYAKQNWETLTIWADFLMESGFDPANQLSTDDFAGHLARNANLSVKAIMAIASYGKLAEMLGETETAEKYTAAAKDMAIKWKDIAADDDHYVLAFESAGTWSQKYNLVWDDILELNIFPDDVQKTEVKYYLTKQEDYGLPLDSRKTYTKSDWVLWTATLAETQEDFEALINPIWDFANTTPDRVPLTDWHETTNSRKVGFKARSVVGGYFIKMLKEESLN
ncbi:glutaminase domain-containing protein [Leeuwenhoekiella sp. H156]|uniref:glutaminase family protein n=1 Tax=Leeuwenhoekiella sp. H156 TaxID=3450128 RepID=UPI003FA42121